MRSCTDRMEGYRQHGSHSNIKNFPLIGSPLDMEYPVIRILGPLRLRSGHFAWVKGNPVPSCCKNKPELYPQL